MKPSRSSIQAITHPFQNLRSINPDGCSDGNSAEALFQPMFCGGASGSTSAYQRARSRGPQDVEDPLERAHRQGYQRGIEAGQKNACQLVQDRLSPVIETVETALKQFDQHHQTLFKSISESCFTLALEIVKKIMGEYPEIKMADMAEAMTVVSNAMKDAYRLNLQMNPLDLELMKEMALCENALAWDQYPSIAVTATDQVPPGEINLVNTHLSCDDVCQKINAALDSIITRMSPP